MCTNFQRICSARDELQQKACCLQACADVDVPAAYHALLKAAEQLFGLEQQLMEDYAFPVRQAHLEQHARVLRALHCAHASVLSGATESARHIGGHLLPDWLHLHHDTIDAAFVLWAEYCDHGLIDPHDPKLNDIPMAH